jgi:acyl-CoA reductase-like NAD-dependent aldehyde dehydrogenase
MTTKKVVIWVSEGALQGFNLDRMEPVMPKGVGLPGEIVEVVCPADGKYLGSYRDTGAEGAKVGIDTATEAFDSCVWVDLDPDQRARTLNRFADHIDREIGGLAKLDALQTGRPIREMRAQVGRISEWFRYFAAVALTYESGVLPFPGAYHAYVEERPIGPVGLITPWNHPLLILCKKLAPALAAGNTCVAKPSELTPLSSLVLARIALKAGIPEGVFNVVPGAVAVGTTIAGDPRMARIDFTGGTNTGRIVGRLAAEALTPTTMELGGKSPVLAFDDVELEDVVSGIMFAAFVASGQTCVAGTRILAHESIADALTARLAERADAILLALPLDERSQMGPLASSRQLEGVRDAVERALEQGATRVTTRVESDLDPKLASGWFYPPTVLGAVDPGLEIARVETFGPVVTITSFSSEEQAVAIANGLDTGLGASVWTRDVSRAYRVASAINAGLVWVNDHHRNSPVAPWGGFGESGFGRENGLHAYRSYLGAKSVVIRTDPEPFDWYAGGEQRYG